MATSAKTVREIIGGGVTDDGSHLVVQTLDKQGQSFNIAFPHSELTKLIDHAARARVIGAKKLGHRIDDKPVFELKAFALGQLRDAPESDIVVLSMTFGTGGEISYWMPQWMARKVSEALQQELAKANPSHH